MAKSVEVELIRESKNLNFGATPIGIKSGEGIFAMAGNRIVPAYQDSTHGSINLNLPDNIIIDDFVFAGATPVMKIDDFLIWENPDSRFEAIALPEKDFRLCPATDSTVYILSSDKFFEFSLKTKKPLTYVSVAGKPVYVHHLDDGLILATEQSVFSLLNNEWKLLYNHPGKINAAAVTLEGFFIGCDKGLWRIAGDNTVELFASGGVSKLFSDAETLFVLDSEGNLLALYFEES